MRLGVLGFGAIGQVVADAVIAGDAGGSVLRAVLCRDRGKHIAAAARLESAGVILTDTPAKFLAEPLDLIVEAAGQDALRDYALRVLGNGCDLLTTSIGAFTDEGFFQGLIACAEQNGARLLLASGALPALDWMAATGRSDPRQVAITQAKPVASWQGTPAAQMVDLDNLHAPTCFFQGTAREAASQFPKSSNITAMLALATVGLDATEVRLVADPNADRMHTEIDYRCGVGNLTIQWQGVPSVINPSTSADVPLTVIKALRNLSSTVCIGP